MKIDFLSLDEAETEWFLRRVFGAPSAPAAPRVQPTPQRAPAPTLRPATTPPVVRRSASSTTTPVCLGDRVQMLDDGRAGIVMRIEGDQYRVLFGWEDNRWARREEFGA